MDKIILNDFDWKLYLELNPDLNLKKKSHLNIIAHYNKYGIKENRKYKYENIPVDFNPSHYIELNEDLNHMTKSQCKLHYEMYGYKENRKYKYENIPVDFNPAYYIELNEDLKHMTELQSKNNYEMYGYKENRKYKYKNIPNYFNPAHYIELNEDLKYMTELQGKNHYENEGYKENRKYKYENIPVDFNAKEYTELNEDLKHMTELQGKNHYENEGYKENRQYKYENISYDFNAKIYTELNNNFSPKIYTELNENLTNMSELENMCICIQNFNLFIIYNKSYLNKNDINNFIQNNFLNNIKNITNNLYVYSDNYNLSTLNTLNLLEYNKFGFEIYTNLFINNFKLLITIDKLILNNIKLINNINIELLPGLIYILKIVNNINIIINDKPENIIFIDKLKYINDNPGSINNNLSCNYNSSYNPTIIFNLSSLNNIDFNLYQLMNNDLCNMNNNELINHYFTKGKYENRILPFKKMNHLFYKKKYTFDREVIFKDIFINFPQFHEDELNNKFWGKGWTDWNNIQNIKPKQFINDSPDERKPLIGYYDYNNYDIRKYHANLCNKYNIYGFCYYYYYFDGVKALHKPIENMLLDNEPNTNFFLLWANEMWSKRWSTSDYDSNILINQDYKKEYWDDNIQNLLNYFKHPKYIIINNKPLLGLCVIHDFEKENNYQMLNYFDTVVKKHGFDGILYVQYLNKFHEKSNVYNNNCELLMERQPNYIINYITFDSIFSNNFIEKNKIDNSVYLFDKYDEERYINFHIDIKNAINTKNLKNGLQHWNNISDNEKLLRKNIYHIYTYDEICKNIVLAKYYGNKRKLNGFFNGWDNTPRIMNSSKPNNICTKIINNEPGQNYIYLLKILEKIRIENTFNEELILYNAWNEWGEGNVIEPCCKYGEQRLSSIYEAKKQFNNNTSFLHNIKNTNKKIIVIFTHYGGGGTEKFLDIFKNDDNIFPIIIRPSYVNNNFIIVSSITHNYKINLIHYKNQLLFNYDYYNIYYYDEINILYNFLLDLNIDKIFINSLVGFSNIIYDMINTLSEKYIINTYLHDYYFLFNESQIFFQNLPNEINKTNCLFNYKKKILQISNKIICPSYYTKYLYKRYINDIDINVVYHTKINKTNFNNIINIKDKKCYKILIYGEINEVKGKNIIQKIINECSEFNFVIHGKCDLNLTKNCEFYGEYKDTDLPNIINIENPDLILFTSIFCETFCYALIPALESIYPIICPNYGSFIELCYGRKNTYYINPYDLNKNKIVEIINYFKSNYYNNHNEIIIKSLKIDPTINYLTLNKLI